MIVHITHQRSKCVGCFACVLVAGTRWRMSRKDGKSVLIGATDKKGMHNAVVGEHEYDQNRKAAQMCPVKIIQVNKIKK